MSEISEEQLYAMEQFSEDWRRGGPAPSEKECHAKIGELIAEIRRLRAVIKKRNHCDDCGKLNPVDNVCEECWRNHCE
ncbi:MAG: hypothetical protein ACR2RF_05370 [Geminicoccaceae bacterium]